MAFFQSSNPALRSKTFESSLSSHQMEVMTEKGTLNKFLFLFLMTLGAASFSWFLFYQGFDLGAWMWGSLIAAFVIALIISFKPTTAPYLAPAYGLTKGLAIGGISAVYNFAFSSVAPNIIMQAILLTFGTALAMYVCYRFGIIRVTERFRSVLVTATLGIAVFYLLAIVLRLFSIDIPFLHESTTAGIIFSLVVVVLAALNLLLDFDTIEQGIAMRAPRYMEWYGAFGLLVTIVWLYLEILRLLSKISKR